MHSANALLLLSLALTACAGSSAHQTAASASAPSVPGPTARAGSRLGPPTPLGIGFRRVDRVTVGERPLALY